MAQLLGLVQPREEKAWGDLTAAPSACKDVSKDVEPGSSQ